MDRQALRDRVRLLSLVEAHDVSDVELNGLLDEGYNVVMTRAAWPFDFTTRTIPTVAGQRNYDVAEGALAIVNVAEAITGRDLRSISHEYEKRLDTENMSSGEPIYFSIRYIRAMTTLALLPIPDVHYDIRVTYRGNFPFGTGDTALPHFHDSFHELLSDWALYRVWEREEDTEKSASSFLKFENRLAEMMDFYNIQAEDRPRIFGERQRSYPRAI